jgi:hypothetical protein
MNITQPLYPRLIETRIAEAMADTPVVLVAGPRQAGKTTLVRQMAAQEMRYLTLDDELTLLAAKEDPVGMIRSLDRAVIDEVQRAPQLLLAIKKTVDEDRRPGRFLLTGSANLMALPTVADSLAGRMETLTLLPLSQSEIHGSKANWIDSAFAGHILTGHKGSSLTNGDFRLHSSHRHKGSSLTNGDFRLHSSHATQTTTSFPRRRLSCHSSRQ